MEAPNLKYLLKIKDFLRIFHFFRIKYTVRNKCINHMILLGISTTVIQKLATCKKQLVMHQTYLEGSLTSTSTVIVLSAVSSSSVTGAMVALRMCLPGEALVVSQLKVMSVLSSKGA